jgi:hypothetical protein
VAKGLQFTQERVYEIEESAQNSQELDILLRASEDGLSELGRQELLSMMIEMNSE